MLRDLDIDPSYYSPHCETCGKPCCITVMDDGIGWYEYWGFIGVDSQQYEVSACCEAGINEGPLPDEEEE